MISVSGIIIIIIVIIIISIIAILTKESYNIDTIFTLLGSA